MSKLSAKNIDIADISILPIFTEQKYRIDFKKAISTQLYNRLYDGLAVL